MSRSTVNGYQPDVQNSRKYYYAYGANCNVSKMASRCPAAERMGKVILRRHKLAFKSVADILVGEGVVHGALWAITPTCEASLDRYEGYPQLYDKKLVTITREGYGDVEALAYVLRQETSLQPPGRAYLNEIMQGYRDFGIEINQLLNAVRAAEQESYSEIARIRKSELDYG